MENVYDYKDIPDGYVDCTVFGKQSWSVRSAVKDGKIPGVRFLTRKGNTKGKTFVDKEKASVFVENIRAKATVKDTVDMDTTCNPQEVVKSVLLVLEVMNQKIDRIMLELGVKEE